MVKTLKWSNFFILAALVGLLVALLCPTAWSVDLSTEDEGTGYIPVSLIQDSSEFEQLLIPAPSGGELGVEEIQSLEYKPKRDIQQIEPPMVTPEATHKPDTLSKPAHQKTSTEDSSQPAARQQADSSVAVAQTAPEQPVYRPKMSTPTFLILPVMVHNSQNKAFGDFPEMMASSFANTLTDDLREKQMDYGVINPVYARQQITSKGLESIYNRLMKQYTYAGYPAESDLTYISDQLSSSGRHVAWVAFVEADMDLNHTLKPHGPKEWIMQTVYAAPPKDAQYELTSLVRVFSTQPGTPMLYERQSDKVVALKDFGAFTGSVFADTDSKYHFQQASHKMARSFVIHIPLELYDVHTDIQAEIVDNSSDSSSTVTPSSAP